MNKKDIYKDSNLCLADKFDFIEQFSIDTTLAFIIIDPDRKKILWLSKHARNLFLSDYSNNNAYFKYIWDELFHSDEEFSNILNNAESDVMLGNQERAFLNEAGEMFVASINFFNIGLDKEKFILADIRDVTKYKQAEIDISHETEVNKLISNIVSQLLGVNAESIMRDSLKNIGTHFNLDTIIINELHKNNESSFETLYWSSENEIIDSNRIVGNNLPRLRWFDQQLLNSKKIEISEINDLPNEADMERKFMANFNIKSIIILPLFFQEKLVGIITIESKKYSREWAVRELEVFEQYGNAIGALIVRKKFEDNLQSAKTRAEKALSELEGAQDALMRVDKMAALGEMVAGVAHEANTPLGIAITISSTLRTKLRQLEAKLCDGKMKKSDLLDFFNVANEGFLILKNNLQHAAELIHSFKRIAVDVTSRKIQIFQILEYLNEVLLNICPRTKRFKNIKILIECPAELTVTTDPGALAQIITNLVLNSLIHAYNNDIMAKGNILIIVTSDDNNFNIIFSDDGAGIADEVLKNIFKSYFTTKRDKGSSGLGMAIICDLVEKNLNGTIDVESNLGYGTKFIMKFPKYIES